MKIPQLELATQLKLIEEEIGKAISSVLHSGNTINGSNVKKIEKTIANYSNNKYGIGVANGSDAIFIALKALEVGQNDAVICPTFTFFATAGSIYRTGATPLFIDIEPKTYNVDVSKLRDYIKNNCVFNSIEKKLLHNKTGKTIKAIIPVHLYGQMCRMDEIMSLSQKYQIRVLEDCAQSIGSEYKGGKAGSYGDIATFSFYPTKNLSTYGDGGMIVTSSQEYANFCRIFRSHGSETKYFHKFVGINSRLDELHAAILNVKFKYLDQWLEDRFRVARRYQELFNYNNLLTKVTLPVEDLNELSNHKEHTFHQYVILVKDRDNLQLHLTKNGIGTSVYYPLSLHLQECFLYLGYKENDFPASEYASKNVLALPMYPELTYDQQCYIVNKIAEFYNINS